MIHTLDDLIRAGKATSSTEESQASRTAMRIAVMGNCATQFYAMALRGEGRLRGMELTVYDADYNQMEIQLLDPESETIRFQPDVIILWLATPVLYEEFLATPAHERGGWAGQILDRIIGCWEHAAAHIPGVRILQPNFPEVDDRAFGNYSSRFGASFISQLRRLNVRLQEEEEKRGDVFPIDLLSLQLRLGQERFYDAPLYYASRMAVSMDAIPIFASETVDILAALSGQKKKCIICDLDGTLWGGIVGDDGPYGIRIGELGEGRAYHALQLWLRQLKEHGMLLAVCSKNDEETAREPFEKLADMVLKLDDFAMFVANWEDKATNIRLIRDTLDIGFDSLVFLDDNPFERNLVREMLPEVTVPELPEDPALWLSYLQYENLFETVSVTGDGDARTGQYQAQARRSMAQRQSASLEDYLRGLRMSAGCSPFAVARYARIAELTQRSNQFNLRTIRYTEDDIRRLAEDPEVITRVYTLRDRFGDYGVVSLVILRRTGAEQAFIDTWIMSCRALKRSLEEFVMNDIVQTAMDHHIRELTAEYIPTAKNGMVRNIYDRMGFEAVNKGRYSLQTGDYREQPSYIQREEADAES